MARLLGVLAVMMAGCAGAPQGDPHAWTRAEWQAKADSECIAFFPKWSMARCVYEVPNCTCELDHVEPGEIMPRVQMVRFNACAVLHKKGEI